MENETKNPIRYGTFGIIVILILVGIISGAKGITIAGFVGLGYGFIYVMGRAMRKAREVEENLRKEMTGTQISTT